MTKKIEGGAHEDNAPSAPVANDATERHLVKARELLKEARSRLSSRDDDVAGSDSNEPAGGDDPE